MPEGDDRSDEVARDENVKHLELLQAIITRLASNSFLIKGWTPALAAAAYGVSVARIDWRLTLLGLAIVVAFWFLDSYFLRQERLFRLLYDHARADIRAIARFSMETTDYKSSVTRSGAFFSTTLVTFYGALLAVGGLIAVLAYHFRP